MRGVIGSLAVIGFVFGMGGLAAGIDVLFGHGVEKAPWPFFFMLPVPFMFVGGGIFFTAVVFFLRRVTLEADTSGITRISRIFFFRRERRSAAHHWLTLCTVLLRDQAMPCALARFTWRLMTVGAYCCYSVTA